MIKKSIILCLMILTASLALAKTAEFKEFERKFKAIDDEIVNYKGEKFVVTDFVYKKDIATFTFTGDIFMIRYVDGRPTTAIFEGQGHGTIDLPTYGDRRSMFSVSKKETIDEEFERCIIRFADDLDLDLREKYQAEVATVKWKTYAKIKEARYDFYFKPTINHDYNNKFQQVRSVYERAADGYFWIDFNRYVYTYDPNRAAPVKVEYEFSHNDFELTNVTDLPAGTNSETTPEDLSNLSYPTTILKKSGQLFLSGLDGYRIDSSNIELKFVINTDSARFISMFLHQNLILDQLSSQGIPVDFSRRKECDFIGVIMPEYSYKNDTVSLNFDYHGRQFYQSLPFVEDMTPSAHKLEFIVPFDYSYIIPGAYETKAISKKKKAYLVEPQYPFSIFLYRGMVSGMDTVTNSTESGVNINILKSVAIDKKRDCYVPDDIFDPAVMGAYGFFNALLGNPTGAFELFVYPDSFSSMPGLVELPQTVCYNSSGLQYIGGFDNYSGKAMSQQWFGNLMKPLSPRENWLKTALNEYMTLLYIQSKSNENYYSNLYVRRDSIYRLTDVNRDRPLFTGYDVSSTVLKNKGAWMFHMLRFLMYDFESGNEANFNRILFDLNILTNGKQYTTTDAIKVIEKRYGEPLDWFFDNWLYSDGYPEYKVKYDFVKESDGYYVDVDINTEISTPNFKMPVIMRAIDKTGQSHFERKMIAAPKAKFRLGPYENEIEEFVFNEMYSVLSKDKVDKK